MTGNDAQQWISLCAEHRREVVGALWLDEVLRSVRLTVHRYPPLVYAETGVWDNLAIEDLVQDVVTTQLIVDGQVDYIVSTALSLDSARALLGRNVRWTLARRRQRTVVDNLLDRVRRLRAGEPDRAAESAEPRRAEPNLPGSTRTASDAELADAVRRLARLPRVPVLSGDRAPTVYTTKTLLKAIEQLGEALPGGFGDRELGVIFGRVLTDHLPGALVIYTGEYDEPSRALSPEEEITLRHTVEDLHDRLDPEQRVLLGMKLASWSDKEIGSALNLSRPTVAKRHHAASHILREQMIDLPQRLQDACLELLTDRLLDDVPPMPPRMEDER